MNLKDKLQTYITQEHSIKKVSPLLQLMQISIPHLKVVQSVTIINEKKGENNSYASKQTGKELRSAPGGMASYKNNLLNSLYDSIDKSIERSTSSSSAEILLEKGKFFLIQLSTSSTKNASYQMKMTTICWMR